MTVEPRGRGAFESLADERDLAALHRLGVREIRFLAQIDLRADPTDEALMAAIAADLGFSLPLTPNTARGSGDRFGLWLGPGEWLIVALPGSGTELERLLRAAAGGAFATTVDVSAGRAAIDLAGVYAREALEAGCSIDLHPRVFGPGSCAQTLLARVNVILWQLSDEPRYRLLVRPSFTRYIARWLADASTGMGDW